MNRGWHEDALRAIQGLSLKQRYITADDLHAVIPDPSHYNKIGPVFDEARRLGLIHNTHVTTDAVRQSRKHSSLQIWESRAIIAAQGSGCAITPDEIRAAYRAQQGLDPASHQMTLEGQEA